MIEWKGSHGRLKESLQAARGKLMEANNTIEKLNRNLDNQNSNFSICYENNRKMFDINKELLGFYKNKSAFDTVIQDEPFLQFKKVDMENFVQDYRYKLEDLNLSLMNHKIKPVSPVNVGAVYNEQ